MTVGRSPRLQPLPRVRQIPWLTNRGRGFAATIGRASTLVARAVARVVSTAVAAASIVEADSIAVAVSSQGGGATTTPPSTSPATRLRPRAGRWRWWRRSDRAPVLGVFGWRSRRDPRLWEEGSSTKLQSRLPHLLLPRLRRPWSKIRCPLPILEIYAPYANLLVMLRLDAL